MRGQARCAPLCKWIWDPSRRAGHKAWVCFHCGRWLCRVPVTFKVTTDEEKEALICIRSNETIEVTAFEQNMNWNQNKLNHRLYKPLGTIARHPGSKGGRKSPNRSSTALCCPPKICAVPELWAPLTLEHRLPWLSQWETEHTQNPYGESGTTHQKGMEWPSK